MIAAALLVVLGSATLMQFAGLSMAMGAFVAGVMLAESSYRHELEADIEPFRGILLGLFFMAVGLSLDLDVVIANWTTILIAVPVLMVVKAATTYALCRLFGCTPRERGPHRASCCRRAASSPSCCSRPRPPPRSSRSRRHRCWSPS